MENLNKKLIEKRLELLRRFLKSHLNILECSNTDFSQGLHEGMVECYKDEIHFLELLLKGIELEK